MLGSFGFVGHLIILCSRENRVKRKITASICIKADGEGSSPKRSFLNFFFN